MSPWRLCLDHGDQSSVTKLALLNGSESALSDVATGASARPVMTKRSCTEPSLTPLPFLKRASRTGPFGVMNHGTVFFAPSKVATAIKGFCAGLVPPAFGCEWQENA